MIPTKKDIQARYLRGEFNYDTYQKLLGRVDQENRVDAAEEQERREQEYLQRQRDDYMGSDAYKARVAQSNAKTPNPYSYYGKKK